LDLCACEQSITLSAYSKSYFFFLTEYNEEIYKLTKLDHFSEVEKMHFPIGHPSDLTMQLMVLATECVRLKTVWRKQMNYYGDNVMASFIYQV